MGSGKSLIGKLLAEKLGLSFLDLDTQLEQKKGTSISVIFEENGEAAFRELEAACLRETEPMHNLVVATGGGAPCFYQNIDWMNENGITVFLEVSPNVLAKRLRAETQKRPLLEGKSDSELSQFIEEKLESRLHFYSQAQFVCHANSSAEEIVDAIANYFKRFLI